MVEKIKILDEDTVGKIAAGEVVERPASVVKELIENSIDAGADSIEIEIQGAGQTLIRVADNGEGMRLEDAKLACNRHATSKISTARDLDHITSLGFRGEALASIAAVSQVDIITKTGLDDSGIYLYFESAQIQRIRPAARSKGTTVEVRNLFYNVPARKKFLKKDSTEMAEIVSVVEKFILSYSRVGFKLVHGSRIILDAPLKLTLEDRVRSVMGEEMSRGMLKVSAHSGEMKLEGFVSRPSLTKKDKRSQVFFLNGRFIRSRGLSEALQRAYKSTLERGRYPASLLFIEMPPETFDINVHPAKLQVKFQDEVSVRNMLEDMISRAFEGLKVQADPIAGIDLARPVVNEEEIHDREISPLLPIAETQKEFGYSYEDRGGERASTNPGDIFRLTRTGSPGGKRIFLGAGDCYLVEADGEGIVITDQHAAHERVLYELFTKGFEDSIVESQNLLFPVRIDLSSSEAIVMDKLKGDLEKLGFQIEPFGERSFLIQGVPAILKDRDVKTLVVDVLADMSVPGMKKTEMADEFLKIVACRSAVKAGTRLSDVEAEDLLRQLGKCRLPFTCPHGRPTKVRISVDDLEKMFRRK